MKNYVIQVFLIYCYTNSYKNLLKYDKFVYIKVLLR